MTIEPISDEDLARMRTDAGWGNRIAPEDIDRIRARLDAAENRVCRWTYCGDIFGNYPKHDASCGEHIVGLATPYCPYCGGRVVVDEEDEE